MTFIQTRLKKHIILVCFKPLTGVHPLKQIAVVILTVNIQKMSITSSYSRKYQPKLLGIYREFQQTSILSLKECNIPVIQENTKQNNWEYTGNLKKLPFSY